MLALMRASVLGRALFCCGALVFTVACGGAVEAEATEPYSCMEADRFTCCDSQALHDELTAAHCFASEAEEDAHHQLWLDSLRSGECRNQHSDDPCSPL
jgi:hypothetical protein